jgi:DNA-binding transcriptional MerR regulator
MSEATMFQSAAAGSEYEISTGDSDWATIGDLAREFDVTLRTLRFYEARGLLTPRREGMNRYYSVKDRARLAVILKGKKLGFTLTEIRQMIAQSEDDRSVLNLSVAQIDDQLKLLRSQLAEVQSAIAELEDRRAAMLAGPKS